MCGSRMSIASRWGFTEGHRPREGASFFTLGELDHGTRNHHHHRDHHAGDCDDTTPESKQISSLLLLKDAMIPRSSQLMDDVAAASAAYLWNILPEIAKLPCVEGFERLAEHFRTAFLAYFDGRCGWGLPAPSSN
jgi:hypothetical protein